MLHRSALALSAALSLALGVNVSVRPPASTGCQPVPLLFGNWYSLILTALCHAPLVPGSSLATRRVGVNGVAAPTPVPMLMPSAGLALLHTTKTLYVLEAVALNTVSRKT